MRVIDFIFALICGRIVGLVVGDFLREFGVGVGFYENIVIWLVFPLLALLFLWIASLIGRKMLVVFQAAKHLLVGTVATVFDLKFFELLIWILGFFMVVYPVAVKAVSFIFSTLIKYWGNKYWAFAKHEKEEMKKELTQFFIITLVGLVIDVAFFYFFSNILGPQFSLSSRIWVKLSVIFAAFTAAVWNFLGYKFFVFKK